MRASLKSLHISDVDLDTGLPPDSENFWLPVQADIGPEGDATAETFALTFGSSNRLMRECEAGGVVWGRHLLLARRFDRAMLQSYLEDHCRCCTGSDWPEIVAKLRRLGEWEYASYQPGTQSASGGGSFAKLLSLRKPNVELSAFWPEDAADFSFDIFASVAGADGNQATLRLSVMSASAFVAGVPDHAVRDAKGHIFMASYDRTILTQAVERRVVRLWGDTWEALLAKLSEYGELVNPGATLGAQD